MDLQDAISSRRSEFTDRLDQLAAHYLHKIREKCDNDDGAVQGEIKKELERLPSKAVDDLTSDELLASLVLDPTEQSQLTLRAKLREILPKLDVPLPQPELEIRPLASFAFAAAGAFAGMMLAGPFVRLLFGFPAETGLLYGGPIGAGVGILVLYKLSQHPKIITGLLWLIGATALTDTVFSIFDAYNPMSRLKGFLSTSEPLISSLPKRLLIYAVVFLLVTLARRKPKFRTDEAIRACEAAIDAWLRHTFDLLVAMSLPKPPPDEPPAPTPATDPLIIDSIVALKKAKDSTTASPSQVVDDAAAAVITAFETVYGPQEISQPNEQPTQSPEEGPLIWDDSLRDRYKTFGIVEPGMPLRILEEPLIRDGQVERRGLVARLKP